MKNSRFLTAHEICESLAGRSRKSKSATYCVFVAHSALIYIFKVLAAWRDVNYQIFRVSFYFGKKSTYIFGQFWPKFDTAKECFKRIKYVEF